MEYPRYLQGNISSIPHRSSRIFNLVFVMFSCSYCKGHGHFKSNCLKLLTKPYDVRNTTICRDYNRFQTSKCEFDTASTSCLRGREHKCSICLNALCKAYNQVNTSPRTQQSIFAKMANKIKELATSFAKLKTEFNQFLEEGEKSAKALEDLQMPPSDPSPISTLDLQDKGILATPSTSANKNMNMAISLGFPLSAVSCHHALYCSNNAELLSRQQPSLSLITADGDSLSAHGLMPIPITFTNNRTIYLDMLIVPNLTHNIIMDRNHLDKLDAIIQHKSLKVSFQHPDLMFEIPCILDPSSNNSVFALTSILNTIT